MSFPPINTFNVTVILPEEYPCCPGEEPRYTSAYGYYMIAEAIRKYFKDCKVTEASGDSRVIIVEPI